MHYETGSAAFSSKHECSISPTCTNVCLDSNKLRFSYRWSGHTFDHLNYCVVFVTKIYKSFGQNDGCRASVSRVTVGRDPVPKDDFVVDIHKPRSVAFFTTFSGQDSLDG